MVIEKNRLFNELLTNFLKISKDIYAIIVSDREGFMIAGETRKNIDLEIVSFLTAVIGPIIERIRKEFSFQKFGTANFDTEDHRLLFVSIDESRTLSLVLNSMSSVDKTAPYAYFLAEKVAQILNAEKDDLLETAIPNFDYNINDLNSSKSIKNQIYYGQTIESGVYHFKFIIIGEHEVGKTSIVRRFVEQKFKENYRTTLGLNVLGHKFKVFGNNVNIMCCDIGAQKFFKRFRESYYDGSQAAFIVFDLTKRESFNKISEWYNELKQLLKNKAIPLVLVGNKKDLTDLREVSYEEGQLSAKRLTELARASQISDYSAEKEAEGFSKISYIETSALTGENIRDAFNLLSYHYILMRKKNEELEYKEKIFQEIKKIQENVGSLNLSFATEDIFWSPGLQILTSISKLGEYEIIIEKKSEKYYKFQNGLILKNYILESLNVSDCDGVFLILDAKDQDNIIPRWKRILKKAIKQIRKNCVILIGVKILEDIDWSELMDVLDVNEEAEEKMVSLLFFRINAFSQLEIYEQLKLMLTTIKSIQPSGAEKAKVDKKFERSDKEKEIESLKTTFEQQIVEKDNEIKSIKSDLNHKLLKKESDLGDFKANLERQISLKDKELEDSKKVSEQEIFEKNNEIRSLKATLESKALEYEEISKKLSNLQLKFSEKTEPSTNIIEEIERVMMVKGFLSEKEFEYIMKGGRGL